MDNRTKTREKQNYDWNAQNCHANYKKQDVLAKPSNKHDANCILMLIKCINILWCLMQKSLIFVTDKQPAGVQSSRLHCHYWQAQWLIIITIIIAHLHAKIEQLSRYGKSTH